DEMQWNQTQNADHSHGRRFCSSSFGSDRSNILRAGALRTPALVVRHLLPFTQIVVLHSLDVRHVEEQVSASSGVDETESFVGQLLDFAFGHLSILKNCERDSSQQKRMYVPRVGSQRTKFVARSEEHTSELQSQS